MEQSQVITILESLANGIDPITGATCNDVFATPDVVRALSTAADQLKNKHHPAAGARWTDEEDAALCREFDTAMSVPDIAKLHGRTNSAITLRLVKLGRIDADTVRVRERGAKLPS
jgi:hypothetical protein